MDSMLPRQRYAQCDSYFVESDEISMAERIRERERQISKIRQREMAAELSSLTSDEYLEDILDHMEHMEVSLIHYQSENSTDLLVNHNARCQLNRYSARNSMVHETVSA
jgi:hypothetical protein